MLTLYMTTFKHANEETAKKALQAAFKISLGSEVLFDTMEQSHSHQAQFTNEPLKTWKIEITAIEEN